MRLPKYQKAILLIFLASCTATGYKPSYIISEEPLIEEGKKQQGEEPLLSPTIL